MNVKEAEKRSRLIQIMKSKGYKHIDREEWKINER